MLQAGLLPELFAMREFLEATRGMPIYEMRWSCEHSFSFDGHAVFEWYHFIGLMAFCRR